MVNRFRGAVELNLDRKRTLRYTLNSLIELESRLEIPLDEIMKAKMDLKMVRLFLWAGLIHEDRDLTVEAAGDLLAADNLAAVMTSINAAMGAAFQSGELMAAVASAGGAVAKSGIGKRRRP